MTPPLTANMAGRHLPLSPPVRDAHEASLEKSRNSKPTHPYVLPYYCPARPPPHSRAAAAASNEHTGPSPAQQTLTQPSPADRALCCPTSYPYTISVNASYFQPLEWPGLIVHLTIRSPSSASHNTTVKRRYKRIHQKPNTVLCMAAQGCGIAEDVQCGMIT